MVKVSSFTGILYLAAAAASVSAKVIWDGRIPRNFALTGFDSPKTSKYSPDFVRPTGTKWSQIIKFPSSKPCLFDTSANAKPFEVTISDKSIFAPGGNAQKGFRRSELIPSSNNGTDPTVNGITTHHFSLKPDSHRPLNLSHEYQLVFIETNDYSSHVWSIKVGTPFGQKAPSALTSTLRLESSTANGKDPVILFQAPWDNHGNWHNFAIQTDWDKSKITVFYSSGCMVPLRRVVSSRSNNSTGKGQAHFGILKLPTDSTNPSQNGYQEKNIGEAVVYGGIFVENGPMVKTKPKTMARR